VQHRHSAYFVSATPEDIAAGISALFSDSCLRDTIAGNALGVVRHEGDLDQQARHVEARYRQLAATIRPRAFSAAGIWATAGSYYRFRGMSDTARPSSIRIKGA
jgi:hypothetical protein